MRKLPISQLWDLIETWGFRVDDLCYFPDSSRSPHHKFTKPKITQPFKNGNFWQFLDHNSSLELDRDMGLDRDLILSRACQTYASHSFRVHFDDDTGDNDDKNDDGDDDEHDGEDQNGHN